jgi:hypothetical protein
MADVFNLPGGPAFPISIPGVGDNGAYGMSLRDYFAGQALIAVSTRWGGTLGDIDNMAAMRSAVIAYEIADAMLKERDRA